MKILFAGTPGVRKDDVIKRLKAFIEEESHGTIRIFPRVLEHSLYPGGDVY